MAIDSQARGLDVTGVVLNRIVAEQPWYKENANFITSLGGFVATVLVAVGSLPIADSPWIQTVIALVGFVLTVLGVKVTRNGFSKSQVRKLGSAQADHVDNAPLIAGSDVPDSVAEPVEEEHDLDALVRAYNERR